MAVRFATLLALSLIPTVLSAQDGAPKEAPAQPVTPAEAPAEKHQWGPWPGPGKVQFRFLYHDFRLTLDTDNINGTDNPVNTGEADSNIDYDTQHLMARVEVAYGLPLGETISMELYGGLGWAKTTVSVEAESGSVISGAGPDVDITAEAEAHFVFSLGFKVRVKISDFLFFGGGFEFIYGRADYDNQFFYDVVDIESDFQVYDVHVQVGIRSGFISGWVGVGFLLYNSDFELEERGGADVWDVELDQGDRVFKGFIGFAVHPGEYINATLQFEFSPDPTARIGLGVSF